MKNRFIAAALAVSAIILCGCAKDGSKTITGTYTYKTSGTVTLMAPQLAGLDAATLAAYKAAGINTDPVMVALYPEQGQMHVIGDGDGKVIITFNDILGNADVTAGTVNGSSLTLEEGHTKTAQLTDGEEKIGGGVVAVSGSGEKYEDMLILDMEYKGTFSISGTSMTVVASDVHCVAQSNE